ncbi:MAG: hypothetical protein L0Y56_13530, partial [Nitrospira sp.]|nr:hypothetical protein [Nitrospira sp.]
MWNNDLQGTGGGMDREALSQHLETLCKELPRRDFLAVLLDWLAKNPSADERVILEGQLMGRCLEFPDDLARYWEQFLHADDLFRREVAALKLCIVSRLKSGALAYRILTEYLGQEPTEDKIEGIM